MQKKSLILQNNSDYMAEIDTLMKDTAVSGGGFDVQSLPSASAEPAKAETALPMAKSQDRSGADSVQSVLAKEKSAPAKSEVTLQMAIDAATQNLEIEAPRKKKSPVQNVLPETQGRIQARQQLDANSVCLDCNDVDEAAGDEDQLLHGLAGDSGFAIIFGIHSIEGAFITGNHTGQRHCQQIYNR